MGFKFSLASVLRLRESVEQREEAALQRAQYEVDRVRQRIEQITEELAAASRLRDEELHRATEAYRLQDAQAGIQVAKEARETLAETLTTLEDVRDLQVEVYQAARIKREMLDDLQADQKNEWEQERARSEQKWLDDVFAARMQRS